MGYIDRISLNNEIYNVKDAFGRAIVANEFDSEQEYNEGDLVLYGENLYKCLSSGSGSWDFNNWSLTTLVENLGGGDSGGGDIDALIDRTIVSYSGSCSTIGSYTFNGCSSLQSVNAPNCTAIGQTAFYNCISLQSVSFPQCSIISYMAFESCSSLQSVNFPQCTIVDYFAFGDCTSLQLISFPQCTSIGGSAFYNCTSLQSANFPQCITIDGFAFYHCSSLQLVSFLNCTSIDFSAFAQCSSLSAIYLLGSSICTLADSGVFQGTPIKSSSYLGYFGSIYVPSSLVKAYKSKTNWAYYSSRITSYIS